MNIPYQSNPTSPSSYSSANIQFENNKANQSSSLSQGYANSSQPKPKFNIFLGYEEMKSLNGAQARIDNNAEGINIDSSTGNKLYVNYNMKEVKIWPYFNKFFVGWLIPYSPKSQEIYSQCLKEAEVEKEDFLKRFQTPKDSQIYNYSVLDLKIISTKYQNTFPLEVAKEISEVQFKDKLKFHIAKNYLGFYLIYWVIVRRKKWDRLTSKPLNRLYITSLLCYLPLKLLNLELTHEIELITKNYPAFQNVIRLHETEENIVY